MLLIGMTAAALLAAVIFYTATACAVWSAALFFVGAWVVLAALAFAFLVIITQFVDLEKEQQEDNKFYRTVMTLYINALKRVVRLRLHTQGLEMLPKDGRFVLVCNHQSIADPVALLHVFPKAELAFITKKENQQMFLIGKLMHKIMCQPLDRDNDRAALKTILKCIQLIKEDKVSIGVFPEGYTSKDGKVHPFRAGVFKIAQKADVPIVVCTIRNIKVLFKNMVKLKPTDAHLHLVGVIPAEELKGKNTVEIGDRIYEMMIADLGEEFRYIQTENNEST